ncbi:MAG: MFS transporter, partial [Lachnospiraceae bacterium]|nr:MFS transporter [Lachnospiraceae bacterium]
MKENKAKRKLYVDIILLVVMAVLLGVVIFNRNKLFFGNVYEFKTAAAAYYGADGRKYVIDEGKTSICFISPDNIVSMRLEGGQAGRFYYAQSLAERQVGNDTVLYINDTAYIGDESGTLEQNRVIEYRNGRYREIYNAGENRIYEIRSDAAGIYILKGEDAELALIHLDDDGTQKLIQREYCGDVLNGASADIDTGCIVVAAKRGALRFIRKDSGKWETLSTGSDHVLPGAVCASNGKVYFSEYSKGRVCRFDESDPGSFETIFAQEDLKINSIGLSLDGSSALCCDLISFYELTDREGGINCEHTEKLPYKGVYITWLLWGALVIAGLILVSFFRFIPGIIRALMHNESALRMTAVIIAVVSVSCFIAWSLISEEHRSEDDWDVSNMKLFTDLVVDNLDVDLLSNINSETDYAGSSYIRLRDKLDLLMDEAAKEGRDYYYVFYRVKDNKLQYLLNYYDSVMCTEPFGAMDDTYYKQVYETRDSYALKTKDADGLWLYVLTPVEDNDGNCVAVLEIGTDLSYRTAERRNQTINIGLSVFCSSAVMVMLIVEGLFLIGFFERKMKLTGTQAKDVTKLIPLRGIIFFAYAAATLQDSFITILAERLFDGSILFISQNIAAGVPLFMNLLMMAVFAAIGGQLEEKYGSKKILLAGAVIEISGFVICAVTGNYIGLVIGNTFAGIGLGLINVVCNAIAAMGEGTEETAAAFADVMAGILSALTIGAGLASLLFPIGGSRLAYSASATLMVPVFFLVSGSVDVKGGESADEGQEVQKIGFAEFFFNKRVIGFLLLLLVPFMISVSYREYFFPLFATENGMPESRIGQL